MPQCTVALFITVAALMVVTVMTDTRLVKLIDVRLNVKFIPVLSSLRVSPSMSDVINWCDTLDTDGEFLKSTVHSKRVEDACLWTLQTNV